jgi:hypothetical protein
MVNGLRSHKAGQAAAGESAVFQFSVGALMLSTLDIMVVSMLVGALVAGVTMVVVEIYVQVTMRTYAGLFEFIFGMFVGLISSLSVSQAYFIQGAVAGAYTGVLCGIVYFLFRLLSARRCSLPAQMARVSGRCRRILRGVTETGKL